MAENLVRRGVQVTIVEMLPQVLAALDYEMAAIVQRELRSNGVHLRLSDPLAEIHKHPDGRLRAATSSGAQFDAGLVLMAIGVRPENDLARQAGLCLGPRGHIIVDQYMRTDDPDIYAVGDAIQVVDPVTGAPTAVPLAGPANRQARIAADHITGLSRGYRGTIGASIVKVFGITASATGANSKALQRHGIPFLASITHTQDHVDYYPGAKRQSIKLLYSLDDGTLLGAQVVGYAAVDRSINVLSTAVSARMTVYDLEHLEQAYAPPYGAAKDPVNIAGFVAGNRLRGDTDLLHWDEIGTLDTESTGLLDVRTKGEWNLGHIPGAVHIPNTELRDRVDELDRGKEWVIYCGVGRRAYVMERLLKQRGYRTRNLTGGWATYTVAADERRRLDLSRDASPPRLD